MDCLCKLLDVGIILTEHPQHEPQRSLTPDARQFGELCDGLFQEL